MCFRVCVMTKSSFKLFGKCIVCVFEQTCVTHTQLFAVRPCANRMLAGLIIDHIKCEMLLLKCISNYAVQEHCL